MNKNMRYNDDEPLFEEINGHKYTGEETIEINKDNIDIFNRLKGHNLIGWCIALIFFIYIMEFIRTCVTGKEATSFSHVAIEIIKILTFSLSGYLFGTREQRS